MAKNKEDRSSHVPQKAKFKSDLMIRDFPWTKKQQEFIQLLQSKETNVLIVKGPAGTAKTHLAVYCALKALQEKKIGEIVYVRSIVESSDHGLGFLPGTQEEKLSPYLQPLVDKLHEFLMPTQVQALIAGGHIRGVPVGYLRGLSLNGAYIIGDEMQNCSVKELLTLSSRLGKFSKLILAGDIKQADVKHTGFEKVYNAFDDVISKANGIHTFAFGLEDIMRAKVIRYIIEKFEDIK